MKIKNWFLIIFVLIMCLCGKTEVFAADETVRVGFSNEDESFLLEAEEENSYARIFLNTLFGHVDATKNFEFVFSCGTEEEMKNALHRGTIDILIAASDAHDWNGEARYIYEYGDVLQMNGLFASEWVAIFVPERSHIHYDDTASLDGRVIGVLNKDYHRSLLTSYLEENKVSMEVKVYARQDEMESALKNGEIDALVSDTNRTSCRRISLYLGYTEKHLYLTADREADWQVLNRAYNKVLQENQYFLKDLVETCYDPSNYLSFTQEQISYMFQSETLTVVYPESRSPDIYKDENGNMAGTFAEYARLIDKKSPLQFEYVAKKGINECLDALNSGEADIILGIYNPVFYKEKYPILSSIPFTKRLFAVIGPYESMLNEPLRLGYQDYISDYTLEVLAQTFPHWTQVRLDWNTRGVQAIEDGIIDVAVVSNDYARQLMYWSNQEMGPLYVFNSDQEISLVIADQPGNAILQDILNQSILRITEEEFQDIEARQIFTIVRDMTFKEFIQQYRWPILLLTLVVGLVSLSVFLHRKNRKKQAEARYDAMSQMLEIQCQHYQELKEYQNAIRTYRHDLKNHTMIINACLENNDLEGLKSYLSDMSEDVPTLSLVDTGNPVLDAILSDRFAKARKLEIQLETEISIPPNLRMEPMDINRLFSNCLDNAIESCQRVSARSGDTTFIRLKLKEKRGYLVFHMENSTLQVIRTSEGGPVSWKNGSEHGLGLNSVKSVIQKYDGYFEERDEEGVFYTEWTIGNVWED